MSILYFHSPSAFENTIMAREITSCNKVFILILHSLQTLYVCVCGQAKQYNFLYYVCMYAIRFPTSQNWQIRRIQLAL